MLITRCPECETSFRITVEQLHKADGQVRCGQCAAVFSAFDGLTETVTEREVDEPSAAPPRPPDASEDGIAAQPADAGPAADAPDMLVAAADEAEAAEAATTAGDIDEDAAAIPDSEVDQVLDVGRNEIVLPWLPAPLAPPRREPAVWRVAAVVAVLALAGQAVHHFRGSLVQQSYVGPPLAELYAKLGFPLEPTWDPTAFEIEARMATAQSSADAESSLEITAGIRNVSSRPLPYPIIHLQLTDRWEKALGTRMFESSEYLPGTSSRRAMLRPGASADITLRLVDPGPDAYGFQVDVCVPAERSTVRCKADAVFD